MSKNERYKIIKTIDIRGNEYYYYKGVFYLDGNLKNVANISIHEMLHLNADLAKAVWNEHKKFIPKPIYQFQLQEYAQMIILELLTGWNYDLIDELRREFMRVIGELRKCKMQFWLPYTTGKGKYRLRPCYLHLCEIKGDDND